METNAVRRWFARAGQALSAALAGLLQALTEDAIRRQELSDWTQDLPW